MGMTLPPLTYLSLDSVSEGIGLSQVARYVERLGTRGVDVTLHSFEKGPPDPGLSERLTAAGVRWKPHRFRVGGAGGGLARVAHAAALIAGADLVHARSDLAAAAAVVTRQPAWVWDLRGFWREQRIAIGLVRPGSGPERVMRSVEAAAARSCTGIVTLTDAAVGVLGDRYGPEMVAKSRVITTCVDLDLFTPRELPELPPVRLLLAGTLNSLYDIPTMLQMVDRLKARCPVELSVLTSQASPWEGELAACGHAPQHAPAADMPLWVARHHAGLSVLRDVGVSNLAATPTKLGEFLASGRPVITNTGLGDMDRLLSSYDCGVVVRDGSVEELDRVADDLLRLLVDPATPGRCRALAREHFDVERGVDQLLAVYRQAAR